MGGAVGWFEADRTAAAAITVDWPHPAVSMRANRNYLARQARFIAQELGIRQFLDIGAGLPTAPHLHEVVQTVAPPGRPTGSPGFWSARPARGSCSFRLV
ncbi:SAM-dependent methyltransferase [Actinoplanes subtropicus]|uniref:SAM-dependent methyltransferase n=1 Tax=Actinoplanes subtropicus TaxID=543632 RepID=UPI0004C2FE66|nr:SAM-dependent methyltransferase [Actinoplanes subtropicus]